MYEESDEIVHVAAGVLRDGDRVLLCQRGFNHRYGLKWEFPGGKTFPGESLRECLARELSEELDVEPTVARELKTIQAGYSDGGKFLITFFIVTAWAGEIRNNVFENIAWVPIADVPSYDVLSGSLPILQYL
jgi:8-oxo-dGTP diphosphatase